MGKGSAPVLDREDVEGSTEDDLLPGVSAIIREDAPEQYEGESESASESAPETAPSEGQRTEPVTIGPESGGDYLLAGWDGLYWVFGARVERWDVTYNGVIAVGLTMSADSDTAQIARDMMEFGPKKLEFLPAYFWAKGETPDQLDNPADIQRWAIQFFRGAGESDSTKFPEYLKKKLAEYKKAYSVGSPRGRKRKVVRLEIESLDDIANLMLDGVDSEKLEALKRTIQAAIEKQNSTVS